MSKVSVTTITDVRHADWNHDVVTVKGSSGTHCKRPCKRCPWRRDSVGVFPAEAFRHSAHTAYDMSDRTFGCHARGTEKTAVCAGFLMVGAEHNLKVRLQRMKGEWTDASDEATSYLPPTGLWLKPTECPLMIRSWSAAAA